MLGHKPRVFRPHYEVCLDDLVPQDNFFRKVEGCLDLEFVRDLVCDLYAVTGRPSIDPVVFFKLQIIAYFEGIRSERQPMETVNMRLDQRWYIGYDLDEPISDHSSLSKIRERYGLDAFLKFFERKDGCGNHEDAEISAAAELVAKYNSRRHPGSRKPWYNRLADKKVSPTDPDATPMQPTGGGCALLGYHDHYVVDGDRDRNILSALVTPASVMDNTPLLDMIS